jgi:hypothetical protein
MIKLVASEGHVTTKMCRQEIGAAENSRRAD